LPFVKNILRKNLYLHYKYFAMIQNYVTRWVSEGEFSERNDSCVWRKSISEGLARNIISAAFNGTAAETTTELTVASFKHSGTIKKERKLWHQLRT
jgi:hypothetical protein